jgi:hypothetical protein
VCGDRATTAKKVMGQQLVDAFAENLQRIRQQRSSVRGREGTCVVSRVVCRVVPCRVCRVYLCTQLLLCVVRLRRQQAGAQGENRDARANQQSRLEEGRAAGPAQEARKLIPRAPAHAHARYRTARAQCTNTNHFPSLCYCAFIYYLLFIVCLFDYYLIIIMFLILL